MDSSSSSGRSSRSSFFLASKCVLAEQWFLIYIYLAYTTPTIKQLAYVCKSIPMYVEVVN